MEFDGIVIALNPLKEEDAMVSVLTIDGIVSFFSRRIMNQKNSYYASMQPLAYSHIWLHQGPQGGLKLKQAQLIDYLVKNYQTLKQYALIELIKETITQLAPTDDYESLFKIVKDAIETGSTVEHVELTALIYLYQLLNVLGWGLELSCCVTCGRKTDIVGIDLTLGGLVCRTHFRQSDSCSPSFNQLTTLVNLRKSTFKTIVNLNISESDTKEIFNILTTHYQTVTGRILKSVKLFN